jgi:hypothetical protein
MKKRLNAQLNWAFAFGVRINESFLVKREAAVFLTQTTADFTPMTADFFGNSP